MPYFAESTQKTLQNLKSRANGLSPLEAKSRLAEYGPNSLELRGEPLLRKLIEPFNDIFMFVLLIAVAISFWHKAHFDAWVILGIIFINAGIYYVQRFSTDRILKTLMQQNSLPANVIRDGKNMQIDASLLVPGDVITLSEGDKIPADARLIQTSSLRVDESQLTGESVPVSKQLEAVDADSEIYERTNMIYQGSFVVGGTAEAVVTDTGNRTEFGRIAKLSASAKQVSPVQQKIEKLVQQIVVAIAVVSVVAFGLALYRGMEWTEALRYVITLAVSAVPEGLAIAITIILALGMRRMARKKALVRNMRAIETVGTITTIATDKTGTLTKNRLTVQDFWLPRHSQVSIDDAIIGAINHDHNGTHDPLDLALDNYITARKFVKNNHAPLLAFPFDQGLSMSGNLWHFGKNYKLYVKGAPEHVLQRCDLTEAEREAAEIELNSLTSRGYRVIALGFSQLKHEISELSELSHKIKLEFAGLIAVADVLRPEAKRSIAAATKAGVTVRMITGDHFETAYQIGKALGMVSSREEVFDSRHMRLLDDVELEKKIKNVKIFARVIPEDKFRILTILKRTNVTAMTGDGVNDVPALAEAHVGLAMGSGSHIAKDAGDIILLDDNFRSVLAAIAEGRTIYANIKRMLGYLLATNTGEVMVAIAALAIGMPLPLAPVQILWINLVTDTTLVIPLGLEPAEKRIMNSKPVRPNAPILNRFMIVRIVIIAITMAAMTLGIYNYFEASNGAAYAQTIAFSALVVTQWASALCARSESESVFKRLLKFSPAFAVGLILSILLQCVALFSPLADFLRITPVAIGDLAITSVIAFILPVIIIEIHKFIGRKKELF